MATETRTINAGPVGLKPKGDYSATATYTLLDCVKYNHDSWVCTAVDQYGMAATITGQAPQDGSPYWQALTDGGRAAYAAAQNADAKAGVADTAAQNADAKATLANTAAQNADAKAALADAKAALADTAAQNADVKAQEAANVNAQISGMTVTITDRQGQQTSVNIGFEIANTYPSIAAMKADAANVLKGQFVMIATTNKTSEDNAKLYVRNSNAATSSNPFTFLSDLDQASTEAWADWLNNMKPQIESAIATAGTDHTRAEADHTQAESDHTQAGQDHTQAGQDHTQAEADHTRADSDHTQAGQDHTAAEAATGAANDAAQSANTAAASVETELSKLTGDLYPRFAVDTDTMQLKAVHVDYDGRFQLHNGILSVTY